MKADKKCDKEVRLNYICKHFIYVSFFHLPQVIDATASARAFMSPKVTSKGSVTKPSDRRNLSLNFPNFR